MTRPTVAVVQHRLLHYRVALFEQLRERLDRMGVELLLVHGQASPLDGLRADEGRLGWALRTKNRYLRLGAKELIWQPLPAQARSADLLVLMQENRMLSNYGLLLRRLMGARPLLGFWGHGRNFQSSAPGGLRERWKGWWLRRVDWWFAYAGSSVRHVVAQGFPGDCVTNLENAVDGAGFARDLAAWSAEAIGRYREELGIAPHARVALYCGSLYAEKRIDVLLEAAERLREQLPDFHLLVVGDGPEGPRVRMAAAGRPWLHALGSRRGADKAACFRLADVLLNPGAVGLHVVDAFVAQVPLITQASARHGPEIDYLVDGVNGLLIADDRPQRYVDEVASLLRQPERLAAMKARCAEAAARYTLENMVGRFADGIAACLRRHGRLA